MNWRLNGACTDVAPDLFFPVGAGDLTVVQIADAKAVCRRCPVMEQCLNWAMAPHRVEGIWGGTTENERRAMRIREDLGPHPVPRRRVGPRACLQGHRDTAVSDRGGRGTGDRGTGGRDI